MFKFNKIITFAFLLVLINISIFLVIYNLNAVNFLKVISGRATSVGSANLTVETVARINFTTSRVDWGSGRVNPGSSFATLTTMETNNVTNGNWTLTTAGGLRIRNDGNVNLTLNLSGTKTAAQLIGGTNPAYLWTVSALEANSCLYSNGEPVDPPIDVDVDIVSTEYCPIFPFGDSSDSVRIDFSLTIPSDSFIGARGDTITAIAFPTS